MPLQEGVATGIAYKFYDSGDIDPNSEPDIASHPGASGGRLLRRVESTLAMQKDTYQSQEVRPDRQIADFRHGLRRVQGAINGELSPKTYQDFMEAVMRANWTAGVSLDETDFTSLAGDASTSKLTLGGGDGVTLGLRVGQIIRITNASAAANNRDFRIIAIGGANNRELTVSPPPANMSADEDCELVVPGRTLINPSSGHVKRKLAIEHRYDDIDVSELFTEGRVGGMRIGLPASGMSTIGFDLFGRNQRVLTGVNAPYFTSPAAPTGTGITAAVNGRLLMNGAVIGVVTGIDLTVSLSPSSEPVMGQNFAPEIFLGRFNLTGNLTAFLQDEKILEAFADETQVSLAVMLTTESIPSSPFMSFYMPRIKLGGAAPQNAGEAGVPIQAPFQVLKSEGGTGEYATTLLIQDSESAAWA